MHPSAGSQFCSQAEKNHRSTNSGVRSTSLSRRRVLRAGARKHRQAYQCGVPDTGRRPNLGIHAAGTTKKPGSRPLRPEAGTSTSCTAATWRSPDGLLLMFKNSFVPPFGPRPKSQLPDPMSWTCVAKQLQIFFRASSPMPGAFLICCRSWPARNAEVSPRTAWCHSRSMKRVLARAC